MNLWHARKNVGRIGCIIINLTCKQLHLCINYSNFVNGITNKMLVYCRSSTQTTSDCLNLATYRGQLRDSAMYFSPPLPPPPEPNACERRSALNMRLLSNRPSVPRRLPGAATNARPDASPTARRRIYQLTQTLLM